MNVKRYMMGGLVAAVLYVGGCGRDEEACARRLLTHNTWLGRFHTAMLGSEMKLIRQGRIDADLTIATTDGTEIGLWLIGARGVEAPRGTAVVIHGLWDSRARLFAIAQCLADRGFDVVLPDLRGHGRSGGVYVTYGGLETNEIKDVMDRLRAELHLAGPVYVVGFSMGGGVAVQYAATEADCGGVVALAPVSDARRIMGRWLKLSAPLADERQVRAIIDRAGAMADFDVDAASATKAAATLTCPVLLVHGRFDPVVPLAHSRSIYAAASGPKRLDVVPWAGHTGLLLGRAGWIADQIDRMARGEFQSSCDAYADTASAAPGDAS